LNDTNLSLICEFQRKQNQKSTQIKNLKGQLASSQKIWNTEYADFGKIQKINQLQCIILQNRQQIISANFAKIKNLNSLGSSLH